MLMWYLSGAAMHGNGRGDRAAFLMLASHKFGDGDGYGYGYVGAFNGDGDGYGTGTGLVLGGGDSIYEVELLCELF